MARCCPLSLTCPWLTFTENIVFSLSSICLGLCSLLDTSPCSGQTNNCGFLEINTHHVFLGWLIRKWCLSVPNLLSSCAFSNSGLCFQQHEQETEKELCISENIVGLHFPLDKRIICPKWSWRYIFTVTMCPTRGMGNPEDAGCTAAFMLSITSPFQAHHTDWFGVNMF